MLLVQYPRIAINQNHKLFPEETCRIHYNWLMKVPCISIRKHNLTWDKWKITTTTISIRISSEEWHQISRTCWYRNSIKFLKSSRTQIQIKCKKAVVNSIFIFSRRAEVIWAHNNKEIKTTLVIKVRKTMNSAKSFRL